MTNHRKQIELRDLINNGYFDDLNDWKQFAEIEAHDLNAKQLKLLTDHLKQYLALKGSILAGTIPTLAQVRDYNISKKQIVDACFKHLTIDYALPLQGMNHLRTLCKTESEADLLQYCVMGYDDDLNRFGALIPLNQATRILLERINPEIMFLQSEAVANV
jgi:hypothetical protein